MNLPAAVYKHATCSVKETGGQIFVLGGEKGGKACSDVMVYLPAFIFLRFKFTLKLPEM